MNCKYHNNILTPSKPIGTLFPEPKTIKLTYQEGQGLAATIWIKYAK